MKIFILSILNRFQLDFTFFTEKFPINLPSKDGKIFSVNKSCTLLIFLLPILLVKNSQNQLRMINMEIFTFFAKFFKKLLKLFKVFKTKKKWYF